MAEKEEKKQLLIRYKSSPTYRIYTADGAFGGNTGDGKLVIDFYVEKKDVPDIHTYDVDENNKISNVPSSTKGFPGLTREKQFGLVLTLNRVIELRNWLNTKIEEAENSGTFYYEKNKDS